MRRFITALAATAALALTGTAAATATAAPTTHTATAPTVQTASLPNPANAARSIKPCREEDGSGQREMCVWSSRDGRGDVIINITRKNGKDDRTVVLIDRTPNR